jgi:hypothetical protein
VAAKKVTLSCGDCPRFLAKLPCNLYRIRTSDLRRDRVPPKSGAIRKWNGSFQLVTYRGQIVTYRADNRSLAFVNCSSGERPEPTKSVDATIEGEPIEFTNSAGTVPGFLPCVSVGDSPWVGTRMSETVYARRTVPLVPGTDLGTSCPWWDFESKLFAIAGR